MKKTCLLFIVMFSSGISLFGQNTGVVTISTELMWDTNDEWIHLRVSDTLTNEIWYDSIATVTNTEGFKDTLNLNSGTYKCEVLDMGAAVSMPTIRLFNGDIIPWGYPEHEYYLFTITNDLNSSSTISASVCDQYISPSSKYIWISSGTYLDTIPNSLNYDSVITVNLTVLYSTISNFNESSCFSYTSPSGKIWDMSDIYLDTIPNANGCDSVLTIDLTVISIDDSISQKGSVLTANQSDANYQWLVCNSENEIEGAIEQQYEPIVTGLYSVRISKDNCELISSCNSIVITNLNDINTVAHTSLFPNPFDDLLNIEFDKVYRKIKLNVYGEDGKSVFNQQYESKKNIKIDLSALKKGIYFIKINKDTEDSLFKIVRK